MKGGLYIFYKSSNTNFSNPHLEKALNLCYNNFIIVNIEILNSILEEIMKRIKTLTTKNLKDTVKKGGCGECQTSCQSACKTSCTVGNQSCENK